MNAEDGNGSRRCPGEFVSPGFLVLCLLFLPAVKLPDAFPLLPTLAAFGS